MSNTSPFNENKNKNNNVMFPQGGEKKVMKKILSVALSTAMAFSMFASVAFGDTAVTPQDKFDALKAKGIFSGYPDGTAGLEKEMTRAEFAKVITKVLGLKEVTGVLSYNDKGYTAKNWAVPYIEAVSAAGIMEGKNVTKKIFDYNGKVTVEEMATVLTRALELEVPTTVDNSASTWAKGYVQAAIEAGLVSKDAKFQSNATRSLLVEAAYAVDQIKSVPTVASYVVSEGGKVVEFTLSNKEVVKVTLEKALEANKETEVTFKDAAGKEITTKVTYVVTDATKVQSVTSTNLKEVEVNFDGKVDKVTATDKDNYSVDQGGKKVSSATLLEDGKTVRLLLADGHKFVQAQDYKIVVKNVKSAGVALSSSEVKFSSSDNTLPTVTEVKALGHKAVKVTFSEPVKDVSSSNFRLDDKTFVGSVTKGVNEREVILKEYAGNFTLGEHKLTTALVEDYAGLKSLSATTDFTVAEDKVAPTVTEITATLEKVTVTFSEDVDASTVSNDSFYWKSGDNNKKGIIKQISGNVYEVDFTENRLPGYETTLYVSGVKDYSGNEIVVKEHKVVATVDLVRPKVADVKYADKKVEIRFDKAVDTVGKREHYTVKNSDGDVISVKSVERAAGSTDNKVFELSFYSDLKEGTYTLKVSGVKDKTVLANVVEDYSTTFVVSDSAYASVNIPVDANNDNRTIAITFDRKMDLASIENPSNYYLTFSKSGNENSTVVKSLPSEARVRAAQDGKSVIIVLPENIDGTSVTFPVDGGSGSGTVRGVSAVGVKTATGNVLTDFASTRKISQKVASLDTTKADYVKQDGYRKIELIFNQVIAQANASDFTVLNGDVSNVSIDGTKVTITTSRDLPASGTTVSLRAGNSLRTLAGNRVAEFSSVNTTDSIAPKVSASKDNLLSQTDGIVKLPFNKELLKEKTVGDKFYERYAIDLDVKILAGDGSKLKDAEALTDYFTTVDGNNLVITFKDKSYQYGYSIKVKKDATYLQATNGKKALESDVYYTAANYVAPSVVEAGTPTYVASTPGTHANETQGNLKFTAKTEGTVGNAISVELVAGTDDDAEVVVENVTDKVVITYGLKATAYDIADKVNTTATSVVKAEQTAGGAVTPGTVTLKGGAPAGDSTVTVAFTGAGIKSHGEVKIDGAVIPGADVTFVANKLTIKVSSNVVGKTLTVANVVGNDDRNVSLSKAITN
ncbi:S-layer homology domain-containing protein [Paenibacillus sp. IHBB 10380]|uniref:S-layer homology domain-containing protein n=1 Tax=Paenibacillus sp. IHBB 10380 TaxID=1566358 RepID=UPI0006968F61|nr:S-layer homology domain-containing protein [Paenibacillus sp. IHBB 10380]